MNSDLIELLRCLKKFKVRHLIIGGHAVIHYSEPRYTKDLDLWVEASSSNAKRLMSCLIEFGAPVDNLSVDDFARPGTLYVFGLPPNRVDILNRAKGASFAAAYKRKRMVPMSRNLKVPFVDIVDLIALKKAAGRPQDVIDLEKLKSVLKLSNHKASRKSKK